MTARKADRIACPLCRRELQAEVSMTARLWRWKALCTGGAESPSNGPLAHEKHGPAIVEVAVRPQGR